MGEALKTLVHLTRLELSVAGKNFGYPGSRNISLALGHMPKLQRLRLDYQVNMLTPRCVFDLNQTLFGRNLTSFHLNVEEDGIREVGALVLIELLESMKALQEATLIMRMSMLTGEAVFAQVPRLRHIPSLELDFGSN